MLRTFLATAGFFVSVVNGVRSRSSDMERKLTMLSQLTETIPILSERSTLFETVQHQIEKDFVARHSAELGDSAGKVNPARFTWRSNPTRLLSKTLLDSGTSVPMKEPVILMEKAKLGHRTDVFQRERADGTLIHSVIVACKQNNLERLRQHVEETSDPRNARYGQHLSREDVTRMVANKKSAQIITQFFTNRGFRLTEHTRNNEYISVEGAVSQWEELLETQFFDFEVVGMEVNKRVVRALQYSLPAALQGHVTAIFNTVQFPDPEAYLGESGIKTGVTEFARTSPILSSRTRSRGVGGASAGTSSSISSSSSSSRAGLSSADAFAPASASASATCSSSTTAPTDGTVTPALLNSVYSIRSNTASAASTQAVYESNAATYSPSDLSSFQQCFGLPIQGVAEDINGDRAIPTTCASSTCVESNLDLQYIIGVAQGAPTTYYFWNSTSDPWLGWITQVANMEDPPLVFSISYASYEIGFSESYAQSFDTEALKLSAMGVTLLSSSGDDGVAGYLARSLPLYCGYNPYFPATSPYVTSAGGTQGPENGNPEVACQSNLGGVITTGGGFSTLYGTPSWQQSAVSTYLQRVSAGGADADKAPYEGYAASGRGYPDLSALAVNYAVWYENGLTEVSGTSASSPVLAGMVSLVNAARIAAGKSSVGWINPSLYAYSGSFANDITSGDNHCTALDAVCCAQGFNSTTGWDPVTGLGSLNFTRFLDTFMSFGDDLNEPTISPTPPAGSPTATPTPEVSAAPSANPTNSPTEAAGWLYYGDYRAQDCGGEITFASSLATGVCIEKNLDIIDSLPIPIPPNFDKGFNSLRFSCGGGVGTVDFFSDKTCGANKFVQSLDLFSGCRNVNEGETELGRYSANLICSSEAGDHSTPVPPFDDGSYAVRSTYSSEEGCEEGTVIFTEALLQGYCFGAQVNGFSYSAEFILPYVIIYPNSVSCSPAYLTSASVLKLVEECSADYGTYYYQPDLLDMYFPDAAVDPMYHVWSDGTSAYDRTPKPTPLPGSPTIAPTTSASIVIQFQVVQTLSGISSSEYEASLATNNQVFSFSAADTMSGVTANDVAVTGISSATAAVADPFAFFARYVPTVSSSSDAQATATAGTAVSVVLSKSAARSIANVVSVLPLSLLSPLQTLLSGMHQALLQTAHATPVSLSFLGTSARSLQSISALTRALVNAKRDSSAQPESTTAAAATVAGAALSLFEPSETAYASSAATASASSNISYTVTFNTAKGSYTSAAAAYAAVVSQLETASSDGQLSATLTYYAKTFGTPDLIGVNATAISVSQYITIGDESGSSTDTLSPGAIAGIVIAVLAVLTACLFAYTYSAKIACFADRGRGGGGREPGVITATNITLVESAQLYDPENSRGGGGSDAGAGAAYAARSAAAAGGAGGGGQPTDYVRIIGGSTGAPAASRSARSGGAGSAYTPPSVSGSSRGGETMNPLAHPTTNNA